MTITFKIGDVVRLQGSGQKMVVGDIADDCVQCDWCDEELVDHREWFDAEAIEVIATPPEVARHENGIEVRGLCR